LAEADKYYPVPQPDQVTRRERDDAMAAYLMMFASFAVGLPLPIINLIAAAIYIFINKGNRFVRFHSLQSFYSQIPVTLLNSVLWVWVVVYLLIMGYSADDTFWSFLLFVGVVNLLYTIFSIVGAIRAYHGRFYYFIFFGRLAYMQAYKKDLKKNDIINEPPKV
jgi:uncharacterized membrane protein